MPTHILDPELAAFANSAFPQFQRVAGTNFPVTSLAFDAAAAESAFWKLVAEGYTSGNITLDLFWYADTASSGDVVWEASVACITPDTDSQDVETKAFATANTVTDSHLGTTGQRLHKASITISNLDSIAAGDVLWLKVARNGASGSDTMTGDAMLVGVRFSYS